MLEWLLWKTNRVEQEKCQIASGEFTLIVDAAGWTVARKGRPRRVVSVGMAPTPASEALGRVDVLARHSSAVEAVPAEVARAAAGANASVVAGLDDVVLPRTKRRTLDV